MAYLPRYFIVEGIPAKWIQVKDGGSTILAFNRKTGEFVRAIGLLTTIYGHGDVEEVTEEEFEAYVKKLKHGLE